MNMGAGNVNGNTEVPLIYDEWTLVQVVFDVDNRTSDIYYDGALATSQDNWSTNGGGNYDNAIVGFDVWSPAGASPLYYDNFNMVAADVDVDGDGDLDADDLTALEANWGLKMAAINPLYNDLDDSGRFDLGDFVLLRAAAEAIGGLPIHVYAPAPAPEPATMSLLALGGLAILRKRRKQ